MLADKVESSYESCRFTIHYHKRIRSDWSGRLQVTERDEALAELSAVVAGSDGQDLI
jgi:hypothetical protein